MPPTSRSAAIADEGQQAQGAAAIASLTHARARLDADLPLSTPDVALLLDVTGHSVRRMVREGRFPPPDIRRNRRAVFWLPRNVRPFLNPAA